MIPKLLKLFGNLALNRYKLMWHEKFEASETKFLGVCNAIKLISELINEIVDLCVSVTSRNCGSAVGSSQDSAIILPWMYHFGLNIQTSKLPHWNTKFSDRCLISHPKTGMKTRDTVCIIISELSMEFFIWHTELTKEPKKINYRQLTFT